MLIPLFFIQPRKNIFTSGLYVIRQPKNALKTFLY